MKTNLVTSVSAWLADMKQCLHVCQQIHKGLAVALLASVLFSLGTSAFADQPDHTKLIVGSEEEYPPFSTGYTDETADGFTVQLWKAVAEKIKLNYSIQVKPFKTLVSDIKSGEVDVLINLAQSDERKQFVDFTVPHVTVSGGIFVRTSDSDIRTEKDLVGKQVIVLNADLAHDYARSQPWGKNLVLVDSASAGFEMLNAGRYDAFVISKLAGEKTIKQLNLKKIHLLDTSVGFEQKFSFAVKKGNADLLAKINEGLALVKSSGEYDAIYDQWFGIYNLEKPLFSDAFYFSIIFTILALILAAYLFYRRVFERERSLNHIREANKSFENVLSAASQFSIIATDLQGEIKIFNTGARAMLGYHPNALIGQVNIIKLHNRAELELRRSKLSEYFKRSLSEFDALVFKALSEEYENFECEYVAEDGTKINVAMNVTPMRNAEDILVGYLFIAQDIRERKKLESIQVQCLDKLRSSEAHKTAILECAPDAIIIMNQEGCFIEFNPAAERLFDYQRSEVIGKKVSDLIMSTEHRSGHDAGMKAYIRTGQSNILGKKVNLPAMRRDGTEMPVEMTIIPFDLDDEQYFIGYAHPAADAKTT